ncbi:putative T7SS-secreted protein [Amycolatopsis pigmentata]|uniref:T7SS-secreted protein n=1 Tax=Amycolatopsis pigmentata TaxID=450801 RepID=A0ABW5G2A6_9PSEU
MAAELGESTDPRDLIPGDPGRIAADLRSLVGTIRGIEGVGSGLGRIDPAQWTGQASSSFRAAFGAEPPKWAKAVDQLGQGARSLADYGDVLTWAQGRAQQAIELYTQARAASRTAAAQYREQAGSGDPPMTPFSDPGQEGARNAKAILADARQKLEHAGGEVASALALEPDGKGGFILKKKENEFGADHRKTKKVWDPEQKKWVDKDPGGWQKGKYGSSYKKEFGDPADGLLGDKIEGTLKALGIDVPEKTWKASANVDVAHGSLDGKFHSGPFSGNGKLEGSVLGAGAEAHATASALGVNAGASAEAYLAKGSAEGEVKFGDHTKLTGSGEALVGAKAEAQGSAGWTGIQGGAEAFAGAKASGDVGAEVAGVGAGAHGEAWAGAGAEASGQLGMGSDGKFHVGGSVGLGLGLGAKVGVNVSVDPGEVVDTATDVGKDIGHAASGVTGAVSGGAKSVWHGLGF